MTVLGRLCWQTLKMACVLAGLTMAAPASHAQSGPFSGLEGNWSGGGTIMVGEGGSERIRCRGSYTVGAQGNALQQSLRCASDSYQFQLQSNVVNQGGKLTGTWAELTRNVSGNIEGNTAQGQYSALVTSAAFTASLTMAARGNKQTISIRSNNPDLRGVQLSLAR